MKPDSIAPFAAIVARREVRVALDRLCRARGWGTLRAVHARPLRAHARRRCTFGVACETTAGTRSLIAKVYADDRPDIETMMDAVARAGFGPDADYSVPEPLLYLRTLRARVEQHVEGVSAREVFTMGGAEERQAAAARCGRWLARFHAAKLQFGGTHDMAHELARCRLWSERVAGFGESFARKAGTLLREIEARARAVEPAEPRPGHGSFVPGHVLLGPRVTTAIDLDDYDMADPARDVAWFAVFVQWRALKDLGSVRALDDAVETFWRAYAAAGGPAAPAHLNLYRAAESLHRARTNLVKRRPPARALAEIMLDEALRRVGG